MERGTNAQHVCAHRSGVLLMDRPADCRSSKYLHRSRRRILQLKTEASPDREGATVVQNVAAAVGNPIAKV
jgi:hypothetical protein